MNVSHNYDHQGDRRIMMDHGELIVITVLCERCHKPPVVGGRGASCDPIGFSSCDSLINPPLNGVYWR